MRAIGCPCALVFGHQTLLARLRLSWCSRSQRMRLYGGSTNTTTVSATGATTACPVMPPPGNTPTQAVGAPVKWCVLAVSAVHSSPSTRLLRGARARALHMLRVRRHRARRLGGRITGRHKICLSHACRYARCGYLCVGEYCSAALHQHKCHRSASS